MAEDLAIALNDGVNVEKRVMKWAPEVKSLPVESLKLLWHQVAHRPDRGPNSLPAMDAHVVGEPLNAISSHQSQTE